MIMFRLYVYAERGRERERERERDGKKERKKERKRIMGPVQVEVGDKSSHLGLIHTHNDISPTYVIYHPNPWSVESRP